MNISDDMLTPEERDLARLLGRPDPVAGPSARVDADILAMARAPQAAADPQLPAAPQHLRTTRWGRRRRVFSSLAAAASLVLVVGLAWQLRSLTPPPPSLQQESADEASSADSVSAPSNEAQVVAEPDPVAPAPMQPMVPPAPIPAAKSAPKAETQPIARDTPPPSAAADSIASPAGQEATVAPYAADPPAAAPVYAPAPPAPAAPVAAAPLAKTISVEQAKQAATSSAESRERAMQFRALPAPPADLAAASGNIVTERAQLQPTIPIDADASLPRHKWLGKIRERRDSGDIEGARASLRRFTQDYPEARIPRDLRPLLKD
ncbi:hypothetical protein [Stenotrophomonas sp. Iso1]|uniref:hypothetical protein n=1 Tax=Stenotrophomonas sp. Iso1 TaxID=2977283 RepID=UPI0022B77CD3|nr:hypothetical protein [Stenotrophomonas sp. Iso1]